MHRNALKGVQLRAEALAMRTDGALRGESLALPKVCFEHAELENFLDREFDGTSGIAHEFPLLVGRRNPGRSLILRERGAIVSHAAWRRLSLCTGERPVSAAGIGLVTTSSGQRGRGLASRVISGCLQMARREGIEVAVLFGRPSALYFRLGFVLAGRERVTRVASDPGAPTAGIRCGGPEDAPQLLPLLERHPLRVSRSAEEFEALLGIPDTQLYLVERSGRPAAYCVMGKGRDLRGVIHEWAGDSDALELLLHGVAALRGEPLWVIGPELVAPPVAGKSEIGPLAMFRVLEPEALGSDDPVTLFGDPDTPPRVPVYVWGLDSI